MSLEERIARAYARGDVIDLTRDDEPDEPVAPNAPAPAAPAPAPAAPAHAGARARRAGAHAAAPASRALAPLRHGLRQVVHAQHDEPLGAVHLLRRAAQAHVHVLDVEVGDAVAVVDVKRRAARCLHRLDRVPVAPDHEPEQRRRTRQRLCDDFWHL